MADIEKWLASLGLDQYAAAFAENDIDMEVLPELEEKDLEFLGLSLGHRKKLLKAAATLEAETDAFAVKPEPDAADQSGIEPAGERRQVTVLFVDLSGFTKLSSESDPEEIHNLLNGFFESTDAIIEDFGGTIDKHIGDNVMAVFGAPVAYTRDEPLPWSDLFIARGRALAAWGGGKRDAATRTALESIREEATRIGLLAPVAALETALGGGSA